MELYNEDCLERLKNIPNKSIDLIFTSPPYWKGFEYESYFNSYLQYINWSKKWIRDIKSKLKIDGFFLLNISNDTETTIKAFEILNICIDEGWKLHDTIIWYRYNTQPCNSNRNLTNQTEFIFLLRHNSSNVNINKDKKLLDKYVNPLTVQAPPLPITPQPVVQTASVVNPNTNLTRTQEALLSPEEKIIAGKRTV